MYIQPVKPRQFETRMKHCQTELNEKGNGSIPVTL